MLPPRPAKSGHVLKIFLGLGYILGGPELVSTRDSSPSKHEGAYTYIIFLCILLDVG